MEQLVQELKAIVASQAARIAELEARLAQNSRNSSRPPSSDPPGTPPRTGPTSRKKKRRRGGQPGHGGHWRALVPPERVNATVEHKPTHCEGCGSLLLGKDADPWRHQVFELPLVRSEVTEHRVHRLSCGCGTVTRGELPRPVAASHFGPRLTALIAVLAGGYRLSHKNIQQLLSDVFEVPIGLGSISALEQRVSEAVAPSVQEAHQAVVENPVVYADETGWREAKHKAWLWVLATTSLAVFRIRRSRGADVARELLATFGGILTSDRWNGYGWFEKTRRQLCWSHLARDFLGFADHSIETAQLSRELLRCKRRMFRLWHRVRDGTLARADFQRLMRPIEKRICALLEEGTRLSTKRVARQCRRILNLRAALFTFVRIDGVSPSNNHAERTIRHGVIWRKTSFGTDSENGSRFVERMLTVVMSLRLQKRNVLDWVTTAYQAQLDGRPSPSLLPGSIPQPCAWAA